MKLNRPKLKLVRLLTFQCARIFDYLIKRAIVVFNLLRQYLDNNVVRVQSIKVGLNGVNQGTVFLK